jgi:2-keto-4-pentenoate hydratase/2-oxohepta-3-ene-1,7-dioic acid hydratase in catechol pathway
MRLVRFGERGRERPGLLASDDSLVDVSSVVTDYDRRFWGEGGLEHLRSEQEAERLDRLPRHALAEVRLGAPVAAPQKLICVGLNYRDHAEETKAQVPEKPVLFTKAVSSINGPNDDIVLPADYETADWEVELAFVIGLRARCVEAPQALTHVAGYLICNDVSERQAQIREGGQWFRGKSFDSYAPLGPWVATPDEVGNPHELDLELLLNGERMQAGNTRTLVFGIPELVSFISRNITLEPGDVVSTGTPPGVGGFRKPPRYLRPGDELELSVSGLGRQRSRVVGPRY